MKNKSWIFKAFIMTFFIALLISGGSGFIADNCSLPILIAITVIVIMLGIMFDIIGTSVLTAEESSFHAKASNKIKGSKESITLVKSAGTIASFCNDVIGDICGIVSGSMSAMIAISIGNSLNIDYTIMTLIVSSIVSSLTVGGKAIGKEIAIKNSNRIIFTVGKLISKFKKK